MAQGSAERCQCSRDQHFQCVLTLKPLILHYTPNWWANIRRAAVSHIWHNVHRVECLWTGVVVNAKVEKCGFILCRGVMSAAAWRPPQRGSDSEADVVAVSEAPRWAPAHRLMGRRCTPENTPLLTHPPCQSKKSSEVKVCVRRNCASYTLCLKSAAHQQWIFRTKRFNINFLHKWSKQHKSKQG